MEWGGGGGVVVWWWCGVGWWWEVGYIHDCLRSAGVPRKVGWWVVRWGIRGRCVWSPSGSAPFRPVRAPCLSPSHPDYPPPADPATSRPRAVTPPPPTHTLPLSSPPPPPCFPPSPLPPSPLPPLPSCPPHLCCRPPCGIAPDTCRPGCSPTAACPATQPAGVCVCGGGGEGACGACGACGQMCVGVSVWRLMMTMR